MRASTGEQQLGPTAQRAALEGYCSRHGLTLLAVHEDLGVSGGAELEDRPGLQDALADLDKLDAGVLLVAKRDRLARDVYQAALIERLAEKAGAKVQAADGTGNGDDPEAQLMRSMVNAFAEFERALIRLRTRAALKVKREANELTGGVPYGKRVARDGVHLEEDAKEQKVIRRILALRERGLSIRAIVDKLNKDQVPARGAHWYFPIVHSILTRALGRAPGRVQRAEVRP